MKVLLAEDEQLAADRLSELLMDCEPSIEIAEKLDSVQDIVEYFNAGNTADLLMLDIQLADGKSFEIFDQIPVDRPVIFTTAYDHYAIEAFKHHSIDYLLKPVKKADLTRALAKYKRLNKATNGLNLDDLKQLLGQGEKTYKERFLIRFGNRLQYKNADEISYFYADGKTTYMVAKGSARKYIVDHALEDLENLLKPMHFFRISRKYIISIEVVKEARSMSSSRLELLLNQPTEHEFVVSRQRIQKFKEWLNQ